MTNTLFKDGVPYVGAIGQNIARGIVPTATGWDTPPSNLENATDGDPTTATGVGSTTLGGGGYIGTIEIDLQTYKNILVSVLCSAWSDGGPRIDLHLVADSYYWGDIGYSYASSENRMTCNVGWVYANKINLQYIGGAADTYYIKIYEIVALEVIP